MLNFKKEYGSFLSLNHITSIVFALLTIDSKVKSKIVSTLEIELKGLSRNFLFLSCGGMYVEYPFRFPISISNP